MLLDDELISTTSKETRRMRMIRKGYHALFYILIIWVWFKNLYLFNLVKDIKAYLTLGNAIELLTNSLVLCISIFILTILGFIKPIRVHNWIKAIGIIGIVICLYYILGPVRRFMVEGLIELESHQ